LFEEFNIFIGVMLDKEMHVLGDFTIGRFSLQSEGSVCCNQQE